MGRWVGALACLFSAMGVRAAEPFRYEELQTLIREGGARTVEEALALLPEDLRSRYLLVHQSRSLQHADPLHPRVILFTDDARLMLAFSGGGSAPSDQELEVIQFRDATDTFDFHRVRFGGEQPVFEQPAVCASCHTKSLRPNWDSYPVWPGVYGAYDDMIRVEGPEGKNFARFVREGAGQGRYAALPGLQDATRVVLDGIRYQSPNGDHFYAISSRKRPYWLRDDVFAPRPQTDPDSRLTQPRTGLKFSVELAELNFRRIARQLKSAPDFERYRAGLLAVLSYTSDVERLVPAGLESRHPIRYAQFLRQTEEGYRRYFDAKLEPLARAFFDIDPMWSAADVLKFAHREREGYGKFQRALDFDSHYASVVAGLRYLAQGLGVDTRNWSTAFDSESHAFFFRNNGIERLASALDSGRD